MVVQLIMHVTCLFVLQLPAQLSLLGIMCIINVCFSKLAKGKGESISNKGKKKGHGLIIDGVCG